MPTLNSRAGICLDEALLPSLPHPGGCSSAQKGGHLGWRPPSVITTRGLAARVLMKDTDLMVPPADLVWLPGLSGAGLGAGALLIHPFLFDAVIVSRRAMIWGSN